MLKGRKPLEALPILCGIIEYARQDLSISEPALTLLVQVFQMAKDVQGVAADYAPILGRYLTQVPPLDGRSLPDTQALREDLLWKSWRERPSRFDFQINMAFCVQQDLTYQVHHVYMSGVSEGGTRIVGATLQDVRMRTDGGQVEEKRISTTRENFQAPIIREYAFGFSFYCKFPWDGQDVDLEEIDATILLTQMVTTRKQTIDVVPGQAWQQSSLDAGKGQATVLGILQVGPGWQLLTDEMADNLDVEVNVTGASGVTFSSSDYTDGPSPIPSRIRRTRPLGDKPVRLEIVSVAEKSTRAVPLHCRNVSDK